MSAKHNLVKTKTNTPGRIAMRRFLRNGLAMSGSVFILLVLFIALMGPFIRPDGTIHANDQHLSLSRLKPGTSIQTIRVKKTNTEEFGILKTWTNGGAPLPFSEIAVSTIIIKGDSVLVLPLAQNDMPEGKSGFLAQELISDPSSSSKGLSSTFIFTKTFLLGTDKYGRDLLSRLMAGSFISLSVGAIAVIISLLLGLTLGLIAGYYRGWLDNVIMWFTNVVWAIPTLILVMAITFAFGTGFWKVFLAVGLTMWVEVARIARGQVLSVREREYVEAARALGFSEVRIIFRHILPNIVSPIIVISAANFASAILIEAGLSFLGLGAQIPTPSWGNMIREHYSYITTDLAYLAIIPGLLIMMLVLSFMMVGNGLRDALDVRE
jgi:peptide/nickel transport system permease protein